MAIPKPDFDTPERRDALKKLFINLTDESFDIKSQQTESHNCIAYAAGVENIPWDPFPGLPYTDWPKGAPENRQLDSLIQAYKTLGFEICENESFEDGIEKIALYGDEKNGEYTHAARQKNGRWASKIGEL
jgi:hypothetical protein